MTQDTKELIIAAVFVSVLLCGSLVLACVISEVFLT